MDGLENMIESYGYTLPDGDWQVLYDNPRYLVQDIKLGKLTLCYTRLHKGMSTRGHSHLYPEIYLFMDTATLYLDNVPQFVRPGEAVIVKPGVHHRVSVVPNAETAFLSIFNGDRKTSKYVE